MSLIIAFFVPLISSLIPTIEVNNKPILDALKPIQPNSGLRITI